MSSIVRARQLRRDSTPAERLLWSRLRGRRLGGWRFRRQQPVAGFVADFYCHEAGLVVEVDGGQHGEQTDADARRTAALKARGLTVMRFWNNEVLTNLDGVLTAILATARKAERPVAPLKPNALTRRLCRRPLPEGEV